MKLSTNPVIKARATPADKLKDDQREENKERAKKRLAALVEKLRRKHAKPPSD